jgi:hypothetical protein
MIYGCGVVRVRINRLLELADRVLIVEVIEIIEAGTGMRIVKMVMGDLLLRSGL